MLFIHVFNVFFYKSEKHVFYVFFICKLMFLTSMLKTDEYSQLCLPHVTKQKIDEKGN